MKDTDNLLHAELFIPVSAEFFHFSPWFRDTILTFQLVQLLDWRNQFMYIICG